MLISYSPLHDFELQLWSTFFGGKISVRYLRCRPSERSLSPFDQPVQDLPEIGVIQVTAKQGRAGADGADELRPRGMPSRAPVEPRLARDHTRERALGHIKNIPFERLPFEDCRAQIFIEPEAGEVLGYDLSRSSGVGAGPRSSVALSSDTRIRLTICS